MALPFLENAQLAAQNDVPVLLRGETGVGKDYLARYIHNRSHRSNGPFETINVAAVPAQLFETELFGHERGAFTGAVTAKPGLLELSSGGTVLLNEVDQIPLDIQPKLLSYLDYGHSFRVGGTRRRIHKTRIISATNVNHNQLLDEKRFRKDLYFRLAGMVIEIPPVRERPDVEHLISDLLHCMCRDKSLSKSPEISRDAMISLLNYTWPGNVRQLKHVLELAVARCGGKCVRLKDLDLSPEPDDAHVSIGLDESLTSLITVHAGQNLKEALKKAQNELVTKALHISHGNVVQSAHLLGISVDAMKYLMRSVKRGDCSFDRYK